MRSGTRNVLLVLCGLVVVLLALQGLDVLDLDGSGGERPADGDEPAPLIGEGADQPEAASPNLEGRPREEDVEAPLALPRPVDLDAVDRNLDLHGIVVHSDGSPVAGAKVQVVTHPWRHQDLVTDRGYRQVVEGPATLSARDGTFAIRLAPGALVALRVGFEGLVPAEIHQLQAGERVRVVLQQAARLRVIVRAPDGDPVEGTRIKLFRLGGSAREAHGVTGADGVFLFDDLSPSSSVMLDVMPPRYGYAGWVDATTPAAGEEATLEVDLEEGRTLSGLVTNADTGKAIEGARVGMNWTLSQEVLTDAKGRYVLPGWTGKGIREITVLAKGYARSAVQVGADDVIDFELAPESVVIGRLVDGGGRPISGARVVAIAYDHEPTVHILSVDNRHSDADGRFRLGGLTADMPHTLVAAAPGYGRTLVDFDLKAGEDGALDLGDVTMPSGLTIAGVVFSASGEPAPRCTVRLSGANADRAERRDGQVSQDSYGATLERTTDDLGRFRFPDLSPGSYTLRARPEGGVEVSRPIRLGNTSQTNAWLRLNATRGIVIRVEDEDGNPVQGVYVSADGRGRQRTQSRTDAEGIVRLEIPEKDVPLFKIQVYAFEREDLLPSQPRKLTAEDRDITVVMRRAGHVKGRLLRVDGTPIFGVSLVAYRGEERIGWSSRTDADGAFNVRVPLGHAVDLVFDGRTGYATDPAFQNYAGRTDGVPVGTAGVVVTAHEIPADRTIEVRVLDPHGEPAVDVQVQVLSLVGGTPNNGRTDAAGMCRFENLREETVTVTAYHMHNPEKPWIAPTGRQVVPEGQTVELRLLRARFIQGQLTSGGGPISGMPQVWTQRPGGDIVTRGGGNRGGRYSIYVPLDEPNLMIVAVLVPDGGQPLQGKVAVPPPDTDTIDIEVSAP